MIGRFIATKYRNSIYVHIVLNNEHEEKVRTYKVLIHFFFCGGIK